MTCHKEFIDIEAIISFRNRFQSRVLAAGDILNMLFK